MTIQRIGLLILLALFLTALPAGAATQTAPAAPATPASVQASTMNGENIDFVRRIGGTILSMHIAGSTAYLISPGEIVAVSIANPAQPAILSRRLLPSYGAHLISGSFLYLGDETGRLRIYDLQNPAQLVELGIFPAQSHVFGLGTGLQIRSLAVQGQYAYMLVYNTASSITSLQIVDISQPAAPAQVGVFDLPMFSWASVVTVAGNYAYLGVPGYTAHIQIVNVANPAAPLSAGVYEFDGDANITLLQVVGNRLYVEAAYPNTQRLSVLDVSNPAQPVNLGDYPGDTPTDNEPGLAGIQGTYAYFHLPNHHGLQAVDLANPAAPVLRGTLNLGPNGSALRLGRVQGQHAYLVDMTPGSQTLLHTVNLANPAAPVAAGQLLISSFSNSFQVAVEGDSLYAIEGNLVGSVLLPPSETVWLQRFSLADPLAPTAGITRSLGFRTTSLVVEDGYAYVSKLWARQIAVLDVSDPAMPVVATFDVGSGIGSRVIAVEGRRAYLLWGSDVTVIDFTAMNAPKVLGTYASSSWDYMLISGGIAWFPHYTTETYPAPCFLKGVDLSNPAAPSEIASLKLDSFRPCDYRATQLAVAGDTLYMATANDRLRVFDISDPAQPAQLAARPINMAVSAVMVENDTVYLENINSLALFDRSIAAGLPRVGQISLPSPYRNFETSLVRNGVFYRSGEGLTILRQRTLGASGAVSQPNGLPFGGATIAASSGASQPVGPDGQFGFQDLPRGPLTFTPSRPGYVFWPPARSLDLPSDNARLFFQATAAPVAADLPAGTQRSLSFTDTQGLPTSFILDTTALSLTSSVAITPTPSPATLFGHAFAGHAFELAVDPAVAVTATIRYSAADLRVASDPAALALWRWTGAAWAAADCGGPAAHDPAGRTFTVALCQPGTYALFAPTHQLVMPFVPAQP